MVRREEIIMNIYGSTARILLSEGILFGNKKPKVAKNAIETPEQINEYKELINQIKKIGPSIIDKYNRDTKLCNKLKNDIISDTKVPKGMTDVSKNIEFKFKFKLEENKFNGTNEVKDNNGKVIAKSYSPVGIYYAQIYIFDDSVYKTMDEFWSKVANDVGFDSFESDVSSIQNDIGKEIISKLHPKLLDVSYSYNNNAYDGILIKFQAKK